MTWFDMATTSIEEINHTFSTNSYINPIGEIEGGVLV
jgi:hypothetical protein